MCAWTCQIFLCGFYCISATKEPVLPYTLYSLFRNITPYPPSVPASHPFVSTRDTTFTSATAQIFYLIWWETLKATISGLKGNKLVHTVFKLLTSLGKL